MNSNLNIESNAELLEFDEVKYNPTDIVKAREQFKEHQDAGIIKNDSFDDEKWDITNQKGKSTLRFDRINPQKYVRTYQSIFGLSYENFILYFKTYLAGFVHHYIPNSLRGLCLCITKVINTPPEDITFNFTAKLPQGYQVSKFLQKLPFKEDSIINDIITVLMMVHEERSVRKQRTLSEYDTYFLFNDIIDDYWRDDLPEKDFLLYFPVYLWWKLTAILPMRPYDYLMTPHKCLKYVNNHYELTIRRTALKGTFKIKEHKIDKDYKTYNYTITDDLATNILKYQKLTEKYPRNDTKTLLNMYSYYDILNITPKSTSHFYSKYLFTNTLNIFYINIIMKKYHLSIVNKNDDSVLKPGTINLINPVDTRHIAIQNIMFSFNDLELAMALAGHEKIDITAHYATNIKKLTVCAVYSRYRKVTKHKVEYTDIYDNFGNAMIPIFNRTHTLVEDGGFCYSDKYANGDYSDCMKIVGDNLSIGNCKYCQYYRKPENPNYSDYESSHIEELNNSIRNLRTAIRAARNLKDNSQGDLASALHRVSSETYKYKEFIKEELIHGT